MPPKCLSFFDSNSPGPSEREGPCPVSRSIVWRVTTQRTFCGSMTNTLSTIRERLTGLGDECRSCVETRNVLSGAWTRRTTSFHPATDLTTELYQSSDKGASTALLRTGIAMEATSLAGTTENEYDAFGRISRTTSHSTGSNPEAAIPDRTTEFTYNAAGDLVARRTFTNATDFVSETWAYDARGNRIASTDTTGETILSLYDANGAVVSEDGATYPIRNVYDTAGRRTGLRTTRDGEAWDATLWAYDPATGLCTAKTYADGSVVSYTYASDGLPLRTTYASGRWVENVYDARRNRIRTDFSDSTSDFLAYDEFSRETAMSNSAASVWLLRDGRGNVTNETASIGSQAKSVDREYDETGRLSLRDGFRLAYAEDGQLASVSNDEFCVVYRYSDDRLDAGYDVFLTNGTVISRTVERDGYRRSLVTNIVSAVNGIAVETLAYTYDAAGRPVTRNLDSFGYNARGEVISATIGESASAYGYDGIGNSTNHPANCLNQYTPLQHDLDGNMVSNGVFGFTYDSASRLECVSSNGAVVATFAYDPMSRRVRKTTAGADHYYFYDGWNLVEERVIGTNGTASAIHYVWGKDVSGTLQGAGGVGGLLAVAVDGAHYFPFYDGNGNITRYLDASGATVAAYAYDAFGNLLSASGPMADAFSLRFSTKYFDPETGLYYYGYRFYAPMLGRWINRDPIEEKGGANLYGFCLNDPCDNLDSLGEWTSSLRGDFSSSERKALQEAMILLKAIIQTASATAQWWHGKIVSLPSSCRVRKAMLSEIIFARVVLNQMNHDIRSDEQLLLRRRTSTKFDAQALFQHLPWDSSIEWPLNTIDVNAMADSSLGQSAVNGNSSLIAKTLFHELSHIAGVPDENSLSDSSLYFENAHHLERIFDSKGHFWMQPCLLHHTAGSSTYMGQDHKALREAPQ